MRIKKGSHNVLLYISPQINGQTVTISEFKKLQGYTSGLEIYELFWKSKIDPTKKDKIDYDKTRTDNEKIVFILPPEMLEFVDTITAEIRFRLHDVIDYFDEEIPINILDNLQ